MALMSILAAATAWLMLGKLIGDAIGAVATGTRTGALIVGWGSDIGEAIGKETETGTLTGAEGLIDAY